MTYTTDEIQQMLAAATPGPWQLRYDGWTIRDSAGNRQIAHTYGRDGSLVEQQVNDAVLIAAAPTIIDDLLKTLARLREESAAAIGSAYNEGFHANRCIGGEALELYKTSNARKAAMQLQEATQ